MLQNSQNEVFYSAQEGSGELSQNVVFYSVPDSPSSDTDIEPEPRPPTSTDLESLPFANPPNPNQPPFNASPSPTFNTNPNTTENHQLLSFSSLAKEKQQQDIPVPMLQVHSPSPPPFSKITSLKDIVDHFSSNFDESKYAAMDILEIGEMKGITFPHN